MKNVAYLRVSTARQETEKNKNDILVMANAEAWGPVVFVEEQVSGKKPWRQRKIAEVLEDLESGDRLIVPELSRLGRSMLEVIEIMSLVRDRGACLIAIKGNWRLDDTIQSKIIGMVFAMASEIERDLLSERTREALAARSKLAADGKTWISKAGNECHSLGRPKGPGKSKLDKSREEIIGLLKNGSTKIFVANRYGCTVQNLANWIKKNEIDI